MTSFGDGVHGARPPIGSDQAAATYRFGKGAVRTAKRGDADASSEEDGRQCACGVYRGVVTNNIDPASQFRVQLRLNADPSAPPLWARPCQPVTWRRCRQSACRCGSPSRGESAPPCLDRHRSIVGTIGKPRS